MAIAPAATRSRVEAPALRRLAAWCVVRRWSLVVWTATFAWTAGLFATVLNDYSNFQFARFDLGDMTQAVWSTAHGRPLEVTSPWGDQVSRLGLHVDPILVLLTPLWAVLPSPLTLAAVQIAACALGALPVFWLARRHLESEKVAALLALAYLTYPWLAWSAWEPIHAVTLAIPLFLFAIWFLDSDRIAAFAVVAVLSVATGELMGLTIAALGVWYALVRGHRLVGGVIALLGFVWSVVAVEVIIPGFLGHESIYYSRFDAVGGSPGGILRTLFTDPGAMLSQLFSRNDVVFWGWLSLPLLGVFVLAPWLAAVALPALLVNGLSDRVAMTDPRFHYVAGVIPFLVVAAVLGLRRLPARGRVSVAASMLVASLALLALLGPLPGTPAHAARVGSPTSAHVDALRTAVGLVPSSAPVVFTNGLGSHLSARRYAYMVPVIGRAEWAVLDMDNSWMYVGPRGEALYPDRLEAIRDHLDGSPRWTKVFEQANVVVYRKASSA